MQLELTQRGDGVLLRVHAVPGARRNGIVGVRHGALRIAVTQVAEKGKANQALLDVLAENLGLRKSQINLRTGAASKQKQFIIESIAIAELRARIAAALQDP